MITLAVLLALYFLPSIVASHRGHGIGGFLVLNLFFGWTVVGWFALLLYALLSAPRYVMYGPGSCPGGYNRTWQRF